MKDVKKQVCIPKWMLSVLVFAVVILLGGCRWFQGRLDEGREAAAFASAAETEETSKDQQEQKIHEETSKNQEEGKLEPSKTEPSGPVLRAGAVAEAGTREDSFFNRQIADAFAKASEELNVETIYLESASRDDYEKNLEILVNENCGLIILPGREMADLAGKAAQLYPKVKFVLIGHGTEKNLENTACLKFEREEVSYLAGVGAGILTKTNQAGLILRQDYEDEKSAGYGYCAGVIDGNPNGEVALSFCSSDLTDQEEASQIVSDMKEKGVDVIYYGAGIAGEELACHCQKAGIRVIGTDVNVFLLGSEPYFASAASQIQPMVYEQIKDLAEGKWERGTVLCDMGNQGTDFFLNEEYVPEELKQVLQTVKERLKTGEITVPDTEDEFEAAYGNGYNFEGYCQ